MKNDQNKETQGLSKEGRSEQTVKRLHAFISSPIGKFLLIILLYAAFITLFVSLLNAFDNSTAFCAIFFSVFIYFGWRALNRITPDVFLIMPLGGWFIYILIKGLLSIFVGVFVAPYYCAKKIVSFIEAPQGK